MSNTERFLHIADAMTRVNEKVNLIGVVTEIGIPKRSKGTDCYCTIVIVDESHPTVGISILVFEESFEKLPHLHSAGDIIQLSHVVVKRHESEVNAVFYKHFSSFAVYKGKGNDDDSASFVPYQVSSKFHGRYHQQHKKLVSHLRRWAMSTPETVSTDSLLLREISQGNEFNLICKVVDIRQVREGEWMLFVWDGTDAPPLNVHPKLEDELEHPVPLQLEEANPLSRDVLCGFPTVGTILRIIADPCSCERPWGLHTLKAAGKWVHFKNIKFEVRFGFWCGILLPLSNFTYLSDDNNLVLKYQRNHNKRFKGKWSRMPLSSFPWPSHVTETDHPSVPFVTLMDMLTYPEVIGKYRCVVRVLATLPSPASGFRGPSGDYMLRLTLEDPTARIHAYLFDEDAKKFLGDSPSNDEIIRKFNVLLGIEEGNEKQPRSPPWIDCCLNSYYIDENDKWGSRTYGICHTKLIG